MPLTDHHIAKDPLNWFRMNHQADNPDDRYLGENAQEAMEHALEAVISAAGEKYSLSHSIVELAIEAREADPDLKFDAPYVGYRIINQYAGDNDYFPPRDPISQVEGYYEGTVTDIEYLLHRALELRSGN